MFVPCLWKHYAVVIWQVFETCLVLDAYVMTAFFALSRSAQMENVAFVPVISTRAIVSVLRYGPGPNVHLPASAIFVQHNAIPITWYKADDIWRSKRRFFLNHTLQEFLAACAAEPRIVTWTTEEHVCWIRAA